MASAAAPPSARPPAAEVLPAELERDPDAWLRLLSWAVIVGSVAQVLVFSFGSDHGAYATVASGLLRGELPYRDLWAPHPPGIFLLFASAFRLFGQNMAAPRVLEALTLVGTVLSCRRLGGVFFDSRTAGLMGGACAALVHAQLDFAETAHPATYGGALTLFAVVAATHDWPRRRAAAGGALVGALFGVALLLQPSLGAGLLPCVALLFFRQSKDGYRLAARLRPLLWALFGLSVPVGILLAWFAKQGALGDLYWTLGPYAAEQAAARWLSDSAPHLLYRALQEALFNQSALLAAGVLAAVAVHPRPAREREGLFLLSSVAALQLAGLAFRAGFQPHEFACTYPLLGLLAGQGLYKLWRRIGPGSPAGVMAFAALLVVLPLMRGPGRDLPQTFWERSRLRLTYLLGAGRVLGREELDRQLDRVGNFQLQTERAVSAELRRRLPAHSPIYVSGHAPLIYWLSGHPPATRALSPAQLSATTARGPTRRQAALLLPRNARLPAAILLTPPTTASLTSWPPSPHERLQHARQPLRPQPLPPSPDPAWLHQAGYVLSVRIDGLELYLLAAPDMLRAPTHSNL